MDGGGQRLLWLSGLRESTSLCLSFLPGEVPVNHGLVSIELPGVQRFRGAQGQGWGVLTGLVIVCLTRTLLILSPYPCLNLKRVRLGPQLGGSVVRALSCAPRWRVRFPVRAHVRINP